MPFDERPPTIASGVRIGTPAATMRGFDEEDFREVGQIIAARSATSRPRRACARIEALCERRPLYPGFRGYTTLRRVSESTVNGVTVVTHPLVQHKLSYLRDKDTPTVHFRKLANELTLLLTYEATKDFPTEPARSRRRSRGRRRNGSRQEGGRLPGAARGLGMLDGVLSLVSSARVGFIGLYRDEETLQPVEYYVKLPESASASATRSCSTRCSRPATPAPRPSRPSRRRARGRSRSSASWPRPKGSRTSRANTRTCTSSRRRSTAGSNERGYIVPGLGDAGDRLYGTK